MRGNSDDDARPPLAVHRVGEVADIEQDDREVEVLHELSQARMLPRKFVTDPERERYPKADENGKGNEPIFFVVREQVLTEGSHSYRSRIVLLDDPTTPDAVAHRIEKYFFVVGNDTFHHYNIKKHRRLRMEVNVLV